MSGIQQWPVTQSSRKTQPKNNNPSIRINPELTKMLELAENMKPIIISIFHTFKEYRHESYKKDPYQTSRVKN